MSASSQHQTLALPKDVEHWSLTTLREKLVKIGTKVARNFPDRFESLGHHELGGVEEPVEMFGLRLDGGQYT